MKGVVLHNIDTAGPGGAESVFATLAARLARERFEPVAVIPHEGFLADRLRSVGLEPAFAPAKGGFNLPYLRALLQLARTRRARLIHSHLLGASVYGALAGRLLGIPSIAVFHGATDLRRPGALASLKRGLMHGRRRAVVAVARGVAAELEQWGLPADSLRVIYNGIDVEHFTPGDGGARRAALCIGAGTIHVGCVGNLRKPKAYDVLMRAAARVSAHNPAVRFSIVGEGDESATRALTTLRDELGLADTVRLLGFQPAGPELFRSFDIFVSSSHSEGLPLSFIEAMATSLPIVATRSGGSDEVVTDGEQGLLVKAGDHDALGDAILRAAGDVQLRRRLGENGRLHAVRTFSLAAMLKSYEDLYDELQAR
jgi:glycosyltransferase involved in cell wall biosynthesis